MTGPHSPRTLRDWLLAPQSVAIVGASDDPSKTASRPLKFLRQSGYEGRIYPVNPRRDTVLGERAWPSLDALPEVPEHAFIVSPTDTVLPAVTSCAAVGVPLVTILANGFGEAGPEGAEREAQLAALAATSGVRIVGPNSMGVVNVRNRLALTANAAFAEVDLPRGHTFVASHSGSMIGALVSRGKARGIGFAGLVSVGSETDLSLGAICEATLDDPDIDAYLLFLETLRHAEAIRRFARAAAGRGKPVVAYKLGRSSAAAELAITHTGALAGADDVASAFLRECGIARVDTLEGALEGVSLVRRIPAAVAAGRRRAVAVVTTTGGGAAMVVDQLGVRGIDATAPSQETLAQLAAKGIEVAPGRIVDLTLAGARYDVMMGALDTLLAAPEFDLVVAVPGSSARFQPELAVQPLIDSAGATKPLAAFVVPDAPHALAQLTTAGVPTFRTPEACADAIAAAFARRAPRAIPERTVHAARSTPRLLDEMEAYDLLRNLGITHAPAVAVDPDTQPPDAPGLTFPVAVKILSTEVAHKSDIGGVVLSVGPDQLGTAIARVRTNAASHLAPGVRTRVIVQEMRSGVGEALIGYRVDPDVGPLVVLASGGVLAELSTERSLRLAPVDADTAREMVAELRAFRALAGYRGRPAGDLDALAQAIVALSRLATHPTPVLEAEINPLIVLDAGRGVVAVDALVRVAN